MGEEVWFGVVREWGGGGGGGTAYESVFDSNKLQSVLPTGKIRANSKLNRFLNRNRT